MRWIERLVAGGLALPHAFGDDADLLDAGALGRVDDVDDVLVASASRSPTMNIVLSLRCSKMFRSRVSSSRTDTSCLLMAMRRSAVYSSTIWLTSACAAWLLVLGFGRQVDVDALCVERQRRHEDDEQHEQHVDERRDVHVRAGVRNLGLDDLVGAEVL